MVPNDNESSFQLNEEQDMFDEDDLDYYGYETMLGVSNEEEAAEFYDYGTTYPMVVDQVPRNETSCARKPSQYRRSRRHSVQGMMGPNQGPGSTVHGSSNHQRSSHMDSSMLRRSRRHSISAIGEGSRLYGNRMQRRVSFGSSSVVCYDKDESVAQFDTESVESIPVKKPQSERRNWIQGASASTVSSVSWVSTDYSNSEDDDDSSPIARLPAMTWDAPAPPCTSPQMPQRTPSPRKETATVVLPSIASIALQQDLIDWWNAEPEPSRTVHDTAPHLDTAPSLPRRRGSADVCA